MPESVPDEALPDCNTCEKPELDLSNHEPILVYSMVHNQQQINDMNGARLGVRFEALIAAIDECDRSGTITMSRMRLIRRVMKVDRAVNEIRNEAINRG